MVVNMFYHARKQLNDMRNDEACDQIIKQAHVPLEEIRVWITATQYFH